MIFNIFWMRKFLDTFSSVKEESSVATHTHWMEQGFHSIKRSYCKSCYESHIVLAPYKHFPSLTYERGTTKGHDYLRTRYFRITWVQFCCYLLIFFIICFVNSCMLCIRNIFGGYFLFFQVHVWIVYQDLQ